MQRFRQSAAWSRFGRDILVIIVGVLIALGFDNWASARADRRLEREYLLRLARDFRADSALLSNYSLTAAQGERAARQLLLLVNGSGEPTSDSLVTRYFGDATRGAFIAPNSPTLEELKSTGNLRVLRDPSLHDAILSYYSAVSWSLRSLETVMGRGRDPLAELGWDIQAFDLSISYAVTRPNIGQPSGQGMVMHDFDLARRFRNHPDATRVTQRAVTYNAMVQSILADWAGSLAELQQQVSS